MVEFLRTVLRGVPLALAIFAGAGVVLYAFAWMITNIPHAFVIIVVLTALVIIAHEIGSSK